MKLNSKVLRHITVVLKSEPEVYTDEEQDSKTNGTEKTNQEQNEESKQNQDKLKKSIDMGNEEFDNGLKHRRKYCYFKENGITEIDYKDVKLLRRFINDQGKIMPRRVTGTSAKMHRKVVRAIRRARSIALMPYTESGLE